MGIRTEKKMITIQKTILTDSKIVTELFLNMWEEHTFHELQMELERDIISDESAIFLAYNNETPVGVAQCRLRKDYVEGTNSIPVGFLEGIYVEEEYRHYGIAKQLSEICENWSRDNGCEEFASDCELNNEVSLKFHLSIGFTEANRIICFTKKLR